MDAATIAAKILASLGRPCTVEGKVLHTTPSIGISLFPANGDDSDTLMKNADTAMYYAKEKGRNNFQFFSPAMTAAASERMELERDMLGALAAGEYELHYQPQVCTKDGHVVGVEALIRWRHPERGLVEPDQFVPLAEQQRLILPIGQWVLREAAFAARRWRDAGRPLPVSVNLSSLQFRDTAFADNVAGVLAEAGIPGSLLEVPGAAAYAAYSFMQRVLGAARVAMVLYLGPIYSAGIAWLVLGERVEPFHLVGAASILGGIWLSTRR